jgi:hypothetical protein
MWECVALLLAMAVAFVIPSRYQCFFELLESLFKRLARRRVLSLLAIAAAAVLLRLALHSLLGTPQPGIHDEFSYLLAADTFAHGRLTNPPHPYWDLFESFHILQQPTYASMYPPAQGLFMAAGILLAGHPWAGVLLSMSLLCSALLWMLRGWLPPEWALLGASLAILRLALFSYWANSYWGGAPAAIGGALVAGSLPRILRRRQAVDAALFGFGLILLASSRPYEGFLFSIPFVISLFVWLSRGDGLREKLVRIVLPACTILLVGAAALAYYDWRITGHPFVTPQLLNAQQYATGGLMIWSKAPPPPIFHDGTMRDFYLFNTAALADVPHSLGQALESVERKGLVVAYFFLGPLFLVPLILTPSVIWAAPARLLVFSMLSVGLGLACLGWLIFPHYFGPATCSLYALVVLSLMGLWKWKWRSRPTGRFLVRGIVAVAILMVVLRISADRLGIDLASVPFDWSATAPGDSERAALAASLSAAPERFLVIVRYGADHDANREWVYNEADINHAKIVWARDRGPETDALVRYFHDRRAVVVEPDVDGLVTVPYRIATDAHAPVP